MYLDDVLVFGKTLCEHNTNLQRVLDRITEAGLKLKPRKCHFAQTAFEYLGHVVSEKGVQTDPRKIAAVEKYPTPRDSELLSGADLILEEVCAGVLQGSRTATRTHQEGCGLRLEPGV